MNEHRSIIVRCKLPDEENAVWKVKDGQTLKLETEEFQVDSISLNESHEQFYSQHISRWVQDTYKGHNLTIIAYGLPNSGKTHCTMGTMGQSRMNPEARGVIVRCFGQLLAAAASAAATEPATRVTASFCHVFDDGRVADLLDTKKHNLQVEETIRAGSSSPITGCTMQVVTTVSDVVKLLEKANLMRNATGVVHTKRLTVKTPVTNIMSMYRPHRSHAVFQYTIEHISNINDSTALVSTLSVIDLAGQSISQFGSDCSDVGLRALNDTLDKLSIGDFENAARVCGSTTLTRLLYPSLFGNSKCLMVSMLPMDSTVAAKTALQLTLSLRKARNNSTPVQTPLGSTCIGKIMSEMEEVRSLLAEKCTGSKTSSSLNVEDSSSVKIDEKIYKDLGEPERKLLQKYLDLKSSLLSTAKQEETAAPSHLHSQPYRPLTLMTKVSTPPTLPLLVSPLKMPVLNPSGLKPVLNSRPPVLSLRPPVLNLQSPIQPPVLNPQSPILNPQSSVPNPQPPVLDPQPPVQPLVMNPLMNPQPPVLNPQHPVPNPQAPVLNPQHSVPSPQPPIPQPPIPSPLPPVLNPEMQTAHSSCPHDSKPPQATALQPIQLPATLSPVKQPSAITMSMPKLMSKEARLKPVVLVQQPMKRLQNVMNDSQSSLSDSEDDQGRVTRQYSRGSSSPPPLNDIPHILPSANDLQRALPSNMDKNEEDTSDDAMEGMTVNVVRIDEKQMSTAKGGGRKPKDVLHSSSSTSITSNSPKVLDKKKKKKIKRRQFEGEVTSTSKTNKSTLLKMESNVHTPTKRWGSSSSSSSQSDEDIFDPNFKPGRLTMQPQRVSTVVPPANYSFNQQIPTSTEWLPPEGVSVDHGDGFHSQDQAQLAVQQPRSHFQPHPLSSFPLNQQQQQQEMSLISEKDIHVAAMTGTKQSHLKQLVMKYGVDYKDGCGRTPLMYSVLGNQPKMCEVLVNCNADLDVVDHSGNTALLWATIQARTELLKILLKYGANICKCDSGGRSVFHWAMRTPNIQCLKILCNYSCLGIENKQDNEQMTPLHWAVMCEQPHHIKVLLKSLPNAEVNPEDAKGRTPLNFAVLNFSPICIQALIDSRASDAVKYSNGMKRTALHYACAESSADCVRTLLSSQCCDLHAADIKGTTPLHWAAASNQPGIIQLLLRRGADRGQTDDSGLTPLDYATQRDYLECVQILQSYGLQRPSSAWSIASQFSIHPPTPPELDQLGHIPLKKPRGNRLFSLFSTNRMPGDGQHSTTEDGEQQQLTNAIPTVAADGIAQRPTNSDGSHTDIAPVVVNQDNNHSCNQNSSDVAADEHQHCLPCSSRSNSVQPAAEGNV